MKRVLPCSSVYVLCFWLSPGSNANPVHCCLSAHKRLPMSNRANSTKALLGQRAGFLRVYLSQCIFGQVGDLHLLSWCSIFGVYPTFSFTRLRETTAGLGANRAASRPLHCRETRRDHMPSPVGCDTTCVVYLLSKRTHTLMIPVSLYFFFIFVLRVSKHTRATTGRCGEPNNHTTVVNSRSK